MQQNTSLLKGAAPATPSIEQRIQQLNREMLSMTMAERRRHWKDYVRRLGELEKGNAASASFSPAHAGFEQSPVLPQREKSPAAQDHL